MTVTNEIEPGAAAPAQATAPRQIYQIYIKASPERVWEAITNPELRAQYFFGGQLDSSTFAVGSAIRTWAPDRSKLWTNNTVLECEPPRRLSHTWRSLYDDELAAEPESRVTWEIEPQEGGYSKLTVIHDQLEQAPKTAKSVSGGWFLIISGLKTVVETGEPLTDFAGGGA